LTKRIPLIALQKALYTVLTSYQTTPVYDDVPDFKTDFEGNYLLDDNGAMIPVTLPYVTLGAFTCKPNGAKLTDISDVSIQIHIWSEYGGKAEVNGIAEDVITVLQSIPIDLSADNYNIMSQDIDFFEAFSKGTSGYHGVLTLVMKIQNIKQS
jgi:hypothetical protein